MASLAQTIKKNRQLLETTPEEAKAQLGRPAMPTSPLESKVLGGHPDSAKMAGTPAQKTSALRESLTGQEGPEDLQTTLRRQQVRRGATEAERGRIVRGEELEKLTSLEERVEELAKQALIEGAQQEQAVQLRAQAEGTGEAALLERIRANPNDMEAIKEFNILQGRDINTLMSAEEILSMFGGESEEIASALAASVKDSISSGELDFEEMGFGNDMEAAETLGLSLEQLSNMSIAQLTEHVNSQLQTEYAQVANLQQRASDVNLGAAERAEARRALREAGAVGIRAVESDMDDLADEIAEANIVEVMGEEMSVEEMLDNEYISGLAKSYLEVPGFADKMKEHEPELADFIERHKAILEESTKQLEAGVQEFAQLQLENQALRDTDVGPLDEATMKTLIPEYGQISATKYRVPDILTMLKAPDVPAVNKQNLMTAISTVKDLSPEYLNEFKDLNRAQIEQLGFTNPASHNFQKVQQYLVKSKHVSNLDQNNPEHVAHFLGASGAKEFHKEIQEHEARKNSGLFEEDSGYRLLQDIIPKGTNLKHAGNKLKEVYFPGGKKLSLAQMVNQNNIPNYVEAFGSVKAANTAGNNLYNTVKSAFGPSDENISAPELDSIITKSTIDDLEEVYTNPKILEKSTPDHKARLLGAAKLKMTNEIKDTARTVTGLGSFPEIIAQLGSVGTAKDYKEWKSKADSLISALEQKKTDATNQNRLLTRDSLTDIINRMRDTLEGTASSKQLSLTKVLETEKERKAAEAMKAEEAAGVVRVDLVGEGAKLPAGFRRRRYVRTPSLRDLRRGRIPDWVKRKRLVQQDTEDDLITR